MLRQHARKRLAKKAKRGFRGFPVASVAFYGPDNTKATKVAVGIKVAEGLDVEELRRWFAEAGDIRDDPHSVTEILAFLKEFEVKSVAMTDGIIGCPHEEGIDYEGPTCPRCPYWAGRDRWAGERLKPEESSIAKTMQRFLAGELVVVPDDGELPGAGDAIDLDAYFRRIGYTRAGAPTLTTLADLMRGHVAAIAFENLNPLLGWPVPLDAAALVQKLVHEGRGGYCFEQNLLFSHILKSLGFRVTGLAARVMWNQPEDAVIARGHMLMRVDLDEGAYLADVGFGGQTLTGPLRLEPGIEQATPHEPFRLIEASDGFNMQARIGDAWKSLYWFDLREQLLPDYEVSNYYLSTHPGSHFRTNLFAARAPAGCRYALAGNRLAVHHGDGNTERRTLTSAAELRAVLEGTFLLNLPQAPDLHAALERIAAQ